ncbi:MAG: PIG-L family deacetylase [Nanoarchaeota archaeon]|nr:PIG-L family deacetylase [Nanoarchaeota archaeon]
MTKSLVIVAHPDDELIWMGGFILKNKDWNFDVITLCRKDDLDRAPRFQKVCKELNVNRCSMSDLEDEALTNVREKDIVDRIKQMLKNNDYDYVFTHGLNGEYGHKRHKEIYKAVKNMVKRKELICKKIFYFSYKKNGSSCYINSNADKFIRLDNGTFSKKKSLIKETYGFPEGGFEEKSCLNKEAFNILKIR